MPTTCVIVDMVLIVVVLRADLGPLVELLLAEADERGVTSG